MGKKLHLPDCLLACSFGESNKFTIEKLNSSRLAFVQKSPLPQKKSGEETLLPIFSEGGGTSVHKLLTALAEKRASDSEAHEFITRSVCGV